jgi:hypothetical protein
MNREIYASPHCRAFLSDQCAESSYGQPCLIIEYAPGSPVCPGESIAYGDGDLLPSGITARDFIRIVTEAERRRGRRGA